MPDWLIAVLWFFCGFAVGFLPSVWMTIERAFRLADMRRKFERAEAGRDAILNILDKLIDSAEYESCDPDTSAWFDPYWQISEEDMRVAKLALIAAREDPPDASRKNRIDVCYFARKENR